MSERDEFLQTVRSALRRAKGAAASVAGDETTLSRDPRSVEARAQAVKDEAALHADELLSQMAAAAAQAGWKVKRAPTATEAAEYVAELARGLEPRSILRTTHPVLDRLGLDALESDMGIGLQVMAIGSEKDETRRRTRARSLRELAAEADIGITGVDYAIVETGTCVLVAREGVSRLVSLLPPVHIAVVERGQVLPSLDELFTLRREELLGGRLPGYMNLISGPSRSADIEYTLVTGVHGPGEVHMVLVG